MLSIGIGYDLHRLIPGRKLILGGVMLNSEFGCEAYSDGDALIHSIIDALLSSSVKKNIGEVFPEDEPLNENRSGLEMLEFIKKEYISNKIKVLSIDSIIIIDRPRLTPFIPEMRKNISSILEIPIDSIGVKAKSSELTKPLIVECHSVALIEI